MTKRILDLLPKNHDVLTDKWFAENVNAICFVSSELNEAPAIDKEILMDVLSGKLDGYTENISKLDGYMVSLPHYEVKVTCEPDSIKLATIVHAVLSKAAKNLFNVKNTLVENALNHLFGKEILSATVGLWAYNGYVYFDISVNIINFERAMGLGKLFGQYSIYDIENDNCIELSH